MGWASSKPWICVWVVADLVSPPVALYNQGKLCSTASAGHPMLPLAGGQVISSHALRVRSPAPMHSEPTLPGCSAFPNAAAIGAGQLSCSHSPVVSSPDSSHRSCSSVASSSRPVPLCCKAFSSTSGEQAQLSCSHGPEVSSPDSYRWSGVRKGKELPLSSRSVRASNSVLFRPPHPKFPTGPASSTMLPR